MTTPTLDTPSSAEASSHNDWLSTQLDNRATEPQQGIPHDQVGTNLAALLEQLRKAV